MSLVKQCGWSPTELAALSEPARRALAATGERVAPRAVQTAALVRAVRPIAPLVTRPLAPPPCVAGPTVTGSTDGVTECAVLTLAQLGAIVSKASVGTSCKHAETLVQYILIA